MIEVKFRYEDHDIEEAHKVIASHNVIRAYTVLFEWERELRKYQDKEAITLEELREKLISTANLYGIDRWV